MRPPFPKSWRKGPDKAPARVRRSGKGQGAFTLIELLLAMVLVGLVLAAIMGVFYGAFRLRAQTVALVEQGLPVQRALSILRQDLAGMVLPGGILSSNLLTDDSSSLAAVRGQRVSPPLFTSNGLSTDLEPWADIQCVTYYLRPPTNQFGVNGLDLFRMVNRNLLPLNTDIPREEWMMSGVERVTFSYYDGTQWKTSWNSTNDVTTLPTAIKVEIQLAPALEVAANGVRKTSGRQVRPVIELISPIFLTPVTNTSVSSSTVGGQP